MVAGSAGSGKTVLAAQFIMAGVQELDAPGILVSLEERPGELATNLQGFPWCLDPDEAPGRLRLIDAVPATPGAQVVMEDYDWSGLKLRLRSAIDEIDAQRLAIDATNVLFDPRKDRSVTRKVLEDLGRLVQSSGVTGLVTVERPPDNGQGAGRYGVEQFASDAVIILRNKLAEERRRRTLEVLKLRGGAHDTGEVPLTITAEEGMVLLPMSTAELAHPSFDRRVSTGIPALDKMLGGGLFEGSATLVSGATGCGKSLLCSHFASQGIHQGDRCLYLTFEESAEQLVRNAQGVGIDLGAALEAGRLRVASSYPESHSLEEHLLALRDKVVEHDASRVVIDSLSALEQSASRRSFREFIIGLDGFLKDRGVTSMFTSTVGLFDQGDSVTDTHLSTLTDTVILLRYVERAGQTDRVLAVLKMRGSGHDRSIRRLEITDDGYTLGEPYEDAVGLLRGIPDLNATGRDRGRTASPTAQDRA